MKKKILLGAIAVVVVVGGVAAMSAFEAHIVNVTAKIENALTVPMTEMDFGTVFPEEVFDQSFTVALSESFMEQAECGTTNLVQNGGFENPEVTDPAKWDIFEDGTSGLGWKVEWRSDIPTIDGAYTRPDPALQELHRDVLGPAYEGDQYAELDTDWYGPGHPQNNEPASVKIYQDVSTVAGRKYRLSFAFSPRPNTSSGDNKLEVNWGGSNVVTLGPVAGGGSINWTVYSYDLTATGSTTRLEFIDKGTANSLGTFLDDVVLVECGRVTSVDYVLRQKPKCVDLSDPSVHPQVEHSGDVFSCPDGSKMMPLLCPYLSKSEETDDGDEIDNDGDPLAAFHGPITGWTVSNTSLYQILGRLSASAGDFNDEWLIDLHVPCFEGYCAQDDGIPDNYQPDPALDGEIFGCDLWIEVTAINGTP